MWAAQHRFILGVGLMLGGLFAGFWAAELLDGRVALPRGSIGFLAAGLAMAAGDTALRRVGGADEGLARYLRGSNGPSLRGLPAWSVGVLLAALGFLIRNQ